MIIWKNEKRKISDLKPAEYNPRRWTEEETIQLRKSIERFDLVDPIIINTDNTVSTNLYYLDGKKLISFTEMENLLLLFGKYLNHTNLIYTQQ